MPLATPFTGFGIIRIKFNFSIKITITTVL